MNDKTVELEIEEIIAELSAPVSLAEHRDGWRQQTKDRAREYLGKLLACLQLQ